MIRRSTRSWRRPSGEDVRLERLLSAGLTGALTDAAAGLDTPPAAPVAVPSPVATLSYSSLTAHARCGYRFYLERVLRLPESDPVAVVEQEGLDPRDRGSIAHLILERLDLAAPVLPTRDEVRALGRRFNADPTLEEADELLALLTGFLAASPLLARLRDARRIRVEAGFALALPSPESPLLNGYLDVLAEEADGTALVVDWKSDRLHGADPERSMGEAYGVQRAVYALAALGTGTPEVEVVHAFLERPDHPVTASFTQADVPELWAGLLAGAAPLLAGAFPVSPAPHLALCNGCPGRGTLCSQPVATTESRSP